MTEEILQSAILRLRSKATEEFGIIKDLYHRPATKDTVDKIANHGLLLAQYEAGVIALRQYSAALASQTDEEAVSNEPEQPTVVEVEAEQDTEKPHEISHDELMNRSKTYRDSMKGRAKDES